MAKARNIEQAPAQRAQALPWHRALADDIAIKRLPAAMMVIGRLGDGIEKLCLELACDELEKGDADGTKMLDAGTHPDLLIVRRKLNTSGNLHQDLLVDQARELIDFLQLTPVRAHRRIVIIVQACRLNSNAANALLNILEEPPDLARLLLCVEQPEMLPATVRSRTVKIVAGKPSRDEAATWLEKLGIDDAAQKLDMADGAPLDAAGDSNRRAVARETFANLAAGRADLLSATKDLADTPAQIWLEWALKWIADCVSCALGLDPRHYLDKHGPRQTAARACPLPWLNLYRELQSYRGMTRYAINNRQLLERVALLIEQQRTR